MSTVIKSKPLIPSVIIQKLPQRSMLLQRLMLLFHQGLLHETLQGLSSRFPGMSSAITPGFFYRDSYRNFHRKNPLGFLQESFLVFVQGFHCGLFQEFHHGFLHKLFHRFLQQFIQRLLQRLLYKLILQISSEIYFWITLGISLKVSP